MSLSYTLLNTWAICPHQAARRYIIKDIPFEQTPAMSEGAYIHDSIALYIRGKDLPESLRYLRKLVDPLVGSNAERSLAMSGQCTPMSFFDKEAWLKGKIDAHIIKGDTAVIFDWKTGKEWEDPFELEIFALLLKVHHPELVKVTGYYVWLRAMKLGEEHDVSDFAGTWGKVVKFYDEIQDKSNYDKKTPGPLCKWCPVTDCPHNKRAAA